MLESSRGFFYSDRLRLQWLDERRRDTLRYYGRLYDVRNLPTSLTRSSVVTSYRYNASGQRIYKKTGTAAAEHYIVDGSVTLRFYKEDGTAD